jgi:hypothetical protein
MEPNFWSDYLKLVQASRHFLVAHWLPLTIFMVISLVVYVISSKRRQ